MSFVKDACIGSSFGAVVGAVAGACAGPVGLSQLCYGIPNSPECRYLESRATIQATEVGAAVGSAVGAFVGATVYSASKAFLGWCYRRRDARLHPFEVEALGVPASRMRQGMI